MHFLREQQPCTFLEHHARPFGTTCAIQHPHAMLIPERSTLCCMMARYQRMQQVLLPQQLDRVDQHVANALEQAAASTLAGQMMDPFCCLYLIEVAHTQD